MKTDDFYTEVNRLWELPFIPKYIKNRSFLLVRLATKYVYDQLPNGVIDRIKEKRGQKRVIRNTSGINY